MLKLALFAALAPLAGYTIFIALLTQPWIQRQALYANNFHTGWLDNVDDPETFGFGKNQVTSFRVKTPDGETLHAIHILPRELYALHEQELLEEQDHDKQDFKQTVAYRLLKKDDKAKLIINFHGNAGHILQNQRPYIYRSFSTLSPHVHLIAFSYRGFGLSTGTPSEAGLISDGVSIVAHAHTVLDIPLSSIALVGQSLGTAVVSGVVEAFTSPASPHHHAPNDDFATILLVSGFSDLPTLLLKYRIGGTVPILAPLARFPALQRVLARTLREPWGTQTRVAVYIGDAVRDGATASKGEGGRKRNVNLQLVHALDDADIPFENSVRNYEAARGAGLEAWTAGAVTTEVGGVEEGAARLSTQWKGVKVGLRLVRVGGHNRVATDTPLAVALMDGLGLLGREGE